VITTLLTQWSRLLMGSLARAGVEQVVISPGSRSTPFTWAALNEPALTCHSLWDERVAAFFALGQARISGKPSVLLCTSGTAAANYHSAVIEASLARVPLLILTADRPFELQHSAAPQAIDQLKLFGDSVRAFFELGQPELASSALEGVLRTVAHATKLCVGLEPGPVHLNVRARKPLEPQTASDAAALALERTVDDLLARGPTQSAVPHLLADVSRLAAACAKTARGVIMVGPCDARVPPRDLLELSAVTGFPLFCEATSQLRFLPEVSAHSHVIDGFEWLLRSSLLGGALRPDLILSFGSPPTSAGYERFLNAGFSGQRFVVSAHGFPDPHGIATALVTGDPGQVARDLCAALRSAPLGEEPERRALGALWQRANQLAWREVERELGRESESLSEPQAVRAILDAVPAGSVLMVGNSLPIREVDAYVPAGPRGLRVLSQRGANGIDGLISGAAGAASLTREPTVLLLGDVSFLHDVGGLAAARERIGPLVVVVIDNGGGRIFDQLPIFTALQQQPDAGRFWLTPPSAELAHAAALYGHHYEAVSSRPSLLLAMTRAVQRAATTIVHVNVAATSSREAEARVRAALESALAELSL